MINPNPKLIKSLEDRLDYLIKELESQTIPKLKFDIDLREYRRLLIIHLNNNYKIEERYIYRYNKYIGKTWMK